MASSIAQSGLGVLSELGIVDLYVSGSLVDIGQLGIGFDNSRVSCRHAATCLSGGVDLFVAYGVSYKK